jgi:oligoendopeptidase F
MGEEAIQKKKRKFFSGDFTVENKEAFEEEFKKLLTFEVVNKEGLIAFLEKWGELLDIFEETYAWKYINMTRFMDKQEYQEAFNKFYSEIAPITLQYDFLLKKKYHATPFKDEIELPEFKQLNKIVSNEIEVFREENIPLFIKEQQSATKYGEAISKLVVEFNGTEKTFSQMNVYLKSPDRDIREKAWLTKYQALEGIANQLDSVFDELMEIRNQEAKNANFENYRDYKHKEKGRFSYSVDDILKFHDVVKEVVVPFLKERNEIRREKLNLDTVRPWDTQVDLDNRVLKPFTTIDEFILKAEKVLSDVDPEFGDNLRRLQASNFLDLDNRKGKAPGGYTMALPEHGSSFIFMNAVGLHSDVRTILHESGHSLHNRYTADILIHPFKEYPMEVAELASMTMEMLTVDYLYEYYDKVEDLKKVKIDQIEGAVSFLPWCIAVDKFQHYIYTHNANKEERRKYFYELMADLNTGVNWQGFDDILRVLWMQQLHIFEVPFYYIEYGFAQLGAIAMYRNFKMNRSETIKSYKEFLSLGYKKPVPELYRAAGIEFNFSKEYISSLIDFVREELKSLE